MAAQIKAQLKIQYHSKFQSSKHKVVHKMKQKFVQMWSQLKPADLHDSILCRIYFTVQHFLRKHLQIEFTLGQTAVY